MNSRPSITTFIFSLRYGTINGPRGNSEDDPSMMIRELQLNIQYLGISWSAVYCFGAVVNHLFPGVSTSLLTAIEAQKMDLLA